ncbi:MAG: hypothetical protein IPN29_10985 [Saprospiraceae bacterium]|nr:hypothetical protein [Saprospiraceae bacterium]
MNRSKLKSVFIEKSRLYHPDLQQGVESDGDTLELSALTNKAFLTLNDELSAFKYLLSLYVMDTTSSAHMLSASFLSEMMELNEEAMEARLNSDSQAIEQMTRLLDEKQAFMRSQLNSVVQGYHYLLPLKEKTILLKEIQSYCIHVNYLKRLKENLLGFTEL